MGILGSFVRTFYRHSSLLSSPIFSSEGTTGDKVASLEGFDPKFDGVCKSIYRAINEAEITYDFSRGLELTDAEYNDTLQEISKALS